MSTFETDLRTISFESIDEYINFELLDLTVECIVAAQNPAADRGKQLTKVYAMVRPMLFALAAIPLVPENWRQALTIFIVTLDGVTASFKAGKDLATSCGAGSSVEMEPKLPVG